MVSGEIYIGFENSNYMSIVVKSKETRVQFISRFELSYSREGMT